jgi:hypothetical protein
MDDKSSINNLNCPSGLKVACSPPGIRAKKFQESSETGTTYIVGGGIPLE